VQVAFVDPMVGAVGTRQNVHDPRSSIWRRVADWLIDVRYLDYVPATSLRGAVVCVSGRTAAYRRSAVMPVLGNLENEVFLGRRCVVGDDGRLTWLVLAQAFTTVHQDSARALSMFPATFTAIGWGVGWLFLSRVIRSFSHLRRHPWDLWIVPVVTLVIMMVALPIKTWSLITMNTRGWLTRRADLIGGEGQNEASLTTGDARGAL